MVVGHDSLACLREGGETQGGRKYIEENTVEKYQMFP